MEGGGVEMIHNGEPRVRNWTREKWGRERRTERPQQQRALSGCGRGNIVRGARAQRDVHKAAGIFIIAFRPAKKGPVLSEAQRGLDRARAYSEGREDTGRPSNTRPPQNKGHSTRR